MLLYFKNERKRKCSNCMEIFLEYIRSDIANQVFDVVGTFTLLNINNFFRYFIYCCCSRYGNVRHSSQKVFRFAETFPQIVVQQGIIWAAPPHYMFFNSKVISLMVLKQYPFNKIRKYDFLLEIHDYNTKYQLIVPAWYELKNLNIISHVALDCTSDSLLEIFLEKSTIMVIGNLSPL